MSKELTAFVTPFGCFCFCRLQFDITFAPENFQCQMSYILESRDGVLNIIDDILVFGQDCAEHDRHLMNRLDRLNKARLTLNRSKCTFGVTSVKFRVMVVGQSDLLQDLERVQAVSQMEAPVDVEGASRVLVWSIMWDDSCCLCPKFQLRLVSC